MTKSIRLPYWDIVSMDKFRRECCEQDQEGVITIETTEDCFTITTFYPVDANGKFADKYPPYYNEASKVLGQLIKAQITKRKSKQ